MLSAPLRRVLCSITLLLAALLFPPAASLQSSEVVSASALTFFNRLQAVATQVAHNEDDGYRVQVLQLYRLDDMGSDNAQILAAEPAAVFFPVPDSPGDFVGVPLVDSPSDSNTDADLEDPYASWRAAVEDLHERLGDLYVQDNNVYVGTLERAQGLDLSNSVVSFHFPVN